MENKQKNSVKYRAKSLKKKSSYDNIRLYTVVKSTSFLLSHSSCNMFGACCGLDSLNSNKSIFFNDHNYVMHINKHTQIRANTTGNILALLPIYTHAYKHALTNL